MKIAKTIITAAALIAAGWPAAAYTPLDSVVMAAVKADKSLWSNEARLEADRLEMSAENTVEAPEIEFEHLWGPDNNRWNVGVSQHIDWPGAYGARRSMGRAHTALGSLMMQIMAFDRALSYKQAVIDIINARQRLDFYRQVDANMQTIAEMTRESYDHGEATILDLYKARISAVDSRREVATAAADMESLVASLRASGAEIPDGLSDVWASYPAQQVAPPSADPTQYPQYAMSQAAERYSAARRKTAAAMSLPSFSIGYIHAYEDRTHFNGLSVSIALPSPARKRHLAVADTQALESSLQYDAELTRAMAEATGDYLSASRIGETMAEYRDLTSDNSYLDLLKTAYDGGELTLIDYITEVNLFTRSRLDYLDLLYRYNLAAARLNRYKALQF